MVEYILNPPKVEAVQWDGTLAGAKNIQQFLAKHDQRRASFHIKVFYHPGDESWVVRDYLEFDGPVPGSKDPELNRFYSQDWLVYWPGNVLEVMNDGKFQRDFREVTEEDASS